MADNILINLSIISKISLDDKIYINDEGFISIENNTIFQGITRFFFRNGRNKTINNLNNFYNGVFNYVDNALPHPCSTPFSMSSYSNKHEDKEFLAYKDKDYGLKTLLLYLRKSLPGLENLKETYSSDIVMTSKLDIIIDNVRLYSDRLEKKIQHYV